jgi:polyisoprenoid-binding protein YceI
MKRSRKAIAIIACCIPALSLVSTQISVQEENKHKAMVAILAASGTGIKAPIMDRVNQRRGALFATPFDANDESQSSPPRYTVDYGSSYLIALTGKSGLFSFAGHNHAVVATRWSAEFNLTLPDLAHSSVSISVPVASLVIDSREARQKAGLGPGPNAADVPTIQQRMLGAEILDVTRFPVIGFRSTSVDLESDSHLRVAGTLKMHGVEHRVLAPVQYRRIGRRIEFDGEFVIRQTDYGLEPESVAGGTIKVNDKVTIRFHVVGAIVK